MAVRATSWAPPLWATIRTLRLSTRMVAPTTIQISSFAEVAYSLQVRRRIRLRPSRLLRCGRPRQSRPSSSRNVSSFVICCNFSAQQFSRLETSMVAGLLQMRGSIALDQFWPTGRSDADTTKIVLTVSPGAIEFRKDSSSPFQPTHVFDHALVKGRTTKPPIKNGQVTVRLQGIDATELHYQPSPLSTTEKKGLSPAKRNAYHLVT